MKLTKYCIPIISASLLLCSTIKYPICMASQTTSSQPVVVELFTSEGCSDCPPADDVLANLERTHGDSVVALEEHVDYFNSAKWTDPFSSSVFTDRQTVYSDHFGGNDVYTPEMVVDGSAHFVGSDSDSADAAIAHASSLPKVPISIRGIQVKAYDVSFSVEVGALPGMHSSNGEADLLVAITEDNLVSHVTGGENGGRTLHHIAVVRELRSAGINTGSGSVFTIKLPLKSAWRRDHLKLVAFTQLRENRNIIGAAEVSLPGNTSL